MLGGDIDVAGRVSCADGKESRGCGLQSRGDHRTLEAIVHDLDLHRRRREVDRDEQIQLLWTHEGNGGGFPVDSATDAIELCGQLIVDKICGHPRARSCGEGSSTNGDPGIRGEGISRESRSIDYAGSLSKR